MLAGQSLIEGLAVPWLVMTTAPRGPVWGALYERGAALVVPGRTHLFAICDLLEEVAAGRAGRNRRRRRQELIKAWNTFARDRAVLTARLSRLTSREVEVLEELWTGQTVRSIAEEAEVTEATVRSQVKAILRKLGVTSQIAAVAVYEGLHTDTVEELPPIEVDEEEQADAEGHGPSSLGPARRHRNSA